MAKNTLSSRDICDILEACAKSKVTSLQFGGLIVSFGTPAASTIPNEEKSNAVTTITEQHETSTRAAIEHDELVLREDQLANALVENPVLFEQMIKDGELEDVDDEQLND